MRLNTTSVNCLNVGAVTTPSTSGRQQTAQIMRHASQWVLPPPCPERIETRWRVTRACEALASGSHRSIPRKSLANPAGSSAYSKNDSAGWSWAATNSIRCRGRSTYRTSRTGYKAPRPLELRAFRPRAICWRTLQTANSTLAPPPDPHVFFGYGVTNEPVFGAKLKDL